MKQNLIIGLLACVLVIGAAAPSAAGPPVWDTAATSTAWDTGTPTGVGANVALSVSNNGEMGQLGKKGVNLDFTVDGADPGARPADSLYLWSGGLYLLRNDGDSVLLTTSIAQKDWTSAAEYDLVSYDFVPVSPMSSGIYNDGTKDVYDSVFIGRLASRDTSVYIERTFYAPRDLVPWIGGFVIVQTRLFTGTKGAQSHLSIGDVIDWDVPSDVPTVNTSHASIFADVTYMRGTVHPDSSFAWDNSSRFASEALLGWATSAELAVNVCTANPYYHGSFGANRALLDDNTADAQPDARAWWDSITEYNYNSGNASAADQAIWMSYLHDLDLTDADTIYFWTALVSIEQGTAANLEAAIVYAHEWYWDPIHPCHYVGCCLPPTVGDMDQSGAVDITDLSVMIDHLFLTLTPLICDAEADINFDGIVDIEDLQRLIATEFCLYPEGCVGLPPCPQ